PRSRTSPPICPRSCAGSRAARASRRCTTPSARTRSTRRSRRCAAAARPSSTAAPPGRCPRSTLSASTPDGRSSSRGPSCRTTPRPAPSSSSARPRCSAPSRAARCTCAWGPPSPSPRPPTRTARSRAARRPARCCSCPAPRRRRRELGLGARAPGRGGRVRRRSLPRAAAHRHRARRAAHRGARRVLPDGRGAAAGGRVRRRPPGGRRGARRPRDLALAPTGLRLRARDRRRGRRARLTAHPTDRPTTHDPRRGPMPGTPHPRPHVLLGAYALAGVPDPGGWYAALDDDGLDGIEHPVDPDDVAALATVAAALPARWSLMPTTVAATARRATADRSYGLASDDEAGRREAVEGVARVLDAARRLAAAGRRVVAAELQSAPGPGTGSAAALERSLVELAAVAPAGLPLVVEHCDAPRPWGVAEKGFLPLEDEIEAVGRAARATGHPLHVGLNWGRSAIEGRGAATPVEHARAAAGAGLLASAMLS